MKQVESYWNSVAKTNLFKNQSNQAQKWYTTIFSYPNNKSHEISIAPFFEPNTKFFFQKYTLNKDH